MKQDPRIVVIGAGPAGISAASTLVAHGLRPIVLDEGFHPGGQVYRRAAHLAAPQRQFISESFLSKATRFHRHAGRLSGSVDYRPTTYVWNVQGNTLFALRKTIEKLTFDGLIICSGAMDRVVPFRGWNRAGVYTLGGAQIALKQGCAIGKRIALTGTGPLLYLLAYQYLVSGVRPEAVLDTSLGPDKWSAALKLAASPTRAAKGMCYVAAIRGNGIRTSHGITPLVADGKDGCIEEFAFRDQTGRERRIGCDSIAVGYGLRSETPLFDVAGCQFGFDETNRQWLPVTDAKGRTTIPSIYAAGDAAGALGAEAAKVSGELAAISALEDTGHKISPIRKWALQVHLARSSVFRKGLEQSFPWPAKSAANVAADVVVCRCEGVTAGEVRRAVNVLGAQEINRVKSYCRAGMGRCQGRYCEPVTAEIIAHTAHLPIAAVGRLRAQAPIKPLPLTSTMEMRE